MRKSTESIKSIVVLSAICLIVAVLLASVNYITAPIIEEAKAGAANNALTEVVPGSKGFEEIELSGVEQAGILGIYKETSGLGYAMKVSAVGYNAATHMEIAVGIGNDGKIIKVSVINCAGETTGIGDKVKDLTFLSSFEGKDSALSDVDFIGGSTYSTKGFIDGVKKAFQVLIDNDIIKAGEKTEEQKIDELKALALPGALNSSGVLQVEETGTPAGEIVAIFKAKNNCGNIFVFDYNGEKLVGAVNLSGAAVLYNLEQNDVTADEKYAALLVKAKEQSDFEKIVSSNKVSIEKMADNSVVTEIKDVASFGSVSSVFTVEQGGKTNYGFVASSFGYHNELIKFAYIINEDGEIVSFRNVTELIIEAEYFDNYELDEKTYKEGFVGKTEQSLTDSDMLISGATITTDAVKMASKSVFETFNKIKEAK